MKQIGRRHARRLLVATLLALAMACLAGACAQTGRPCVSGLDCPGSCLTGNSPSECSCIF